MTRNQKIAAGCGGAGCLGLIVVGIACVLIYYFYFSYAAAPYRDSNFNASTNRNSNSNDNSDITTNRNGNDNDNSSNTNSSSSSTSSLSDDDKHKLYHAALVTGDEALIRRVSVKLGLMNEDYTPGDEMTQFIASHAVWTFSNRDFIQTVNTAEKARAYVDENFPN